ncbi:carbamate kinase [Haloparvum alkalitolerans]|uniref:amino acid kinase family protein n=1 Tax=Haloparvum alkalitolerans TaxID=1042953 RepID=UPI003CF71AAC
MSDTVVALGGNAILESGEGTVADQRARIRETRDALAPLVERGHDLTLTHGNGPQVGHRLLAEEAAEGDPEPLDVLVAETQAQVGYLLAGEFGDALGGRPTAVVTRVRVDPDDSAFENPQKPVGPYYSAEEAAAKPFETTAVHRSSGSADGRDDAAGGATAHRRVVPSPEPEELLEADRIRRLADDDGGPVICGGGGGVPVVPADGGDGGDGGDSDDGGTAPDAGAYDGVAAVVDKDRTSRLVAEAVGADTLLFLTDVDAAYLDYGTPDQRRLAEATPAEVREHAADDQFPAGSMGPKIDACATFAGETGGEALIAAPDRLAEALDGDSGTRIVPE